MVLSLCVQQLIEHVPSAFAVGFGPEEGEKLVATHAAVASDGEHHEYRQSAPLSCRAGEILPASNESHPAECGESEHGPVDCRLIEG